MWRWVYNLQVTNSWEVAVHSKCSSCQERHEYLRAERPLCCILLEKKNFTFVSSFAKELCPNNQTELTEYWDLNGLLGLFLNFWTLRRSLSELWRSRCPLFRILAALFFRSSHKLNSNWCERHVFERHPITIRTTRIPRWLPSFSWWVEATS